MVLIDSAGAGDIISMAGLASPSIGHTVTTVEVCWLIYKSQLELVIASPILIYFLCLVSHKQLKILLLVSFSFFSQIKILIYNT